jgi:chromosome partitioning protein
MKIISVYLQKGGVGKTTFSWLLGEGLTYCGKEKNPKVLLIDFCSQRNLSQIFLKPNKITDVIKECNIMKVMAGESIADNAVQTGFRNLFIVPGSKELKAKNVNLERLPIAIDELKKSGLDIDYVIIDNNPSNEDLAQSSILAADMVLVPFNADQFSYNGILDVEEIMTTKFPGKDYRIVTTYHKTGRINTVSAYKEAAREAFGDKFLMHSIPSSHDIENAKVEGKSLYVLKKSGKISDAYFMLIAELFKYDFETSVMNMIKQKKQRKSELAKKNLEKLNQEGAVNG